MDDDLLGKLEGELAYDNAIRKLKAELKEVPPDSEPEQENLGNDARIKNIYVNNQYLELEKEIKEKDKEGGELYG